MEGGGVLDWREIERGDSVELLIEEGTVLGFGAGCIRIVVPSE